MLKIGDQVPDFSLPNEKGEMVHLKELIGQKPLIIYFYPKDDTPGCTREACSFRDHYEQFEGNNALIFGISSDKEESHLKFKSKHRIPYQLLSDRNSLVAKKFGVKKHFGILPGRVTFVINESGKICHVINSQFTPDRHVKESLKVLNQLNIRLHE